MGFRHIGRKVAIQALYQINVRHQPVKDFIDQFVSQSTFSSDSLKWGKELALNVADSLNEVDKLISDYSIGWTIDRISLVDLSILRLAFYELIKTDTPHTIILNEAVELSKEFSEDDSPKFINGILGNYVKNVYGTDKKTK